MTQRQSFEHSIRFREPWPVFVVVRVDVSVRGGISMKAEEEDFGQVTAKVL